MVCNKLNKLLRIALLSLVMSLSGCARIMPEIVVLRDVPKSPVFVVFPANDYLREVEFANNVEDAIINTAVKFVIRPAIKEVTTEKTVHETEGRQAGSDEVVLAADAKLTKRHFTF